ncbi:MAG: T9SS type A sorting domain-containing protein [Ignavibacteriae bacterium]|nr:T9SS type A sorting domain-containing protein [Ignavibacteriota bacterium]
MKFILTVLVLLGLTTGIYAQNYVGTGACRTCHSGNFNEWKTTLHSQIHMNPVAGNFRPNWTGSVSMGASYGNATVSLSIDAGLYKATLNPSSGTPATYEIKYTYGGGYKQRYLVLIASNYYMLPIQWNLKGYLDNSSGAWASYNPGNWFNADGTLKAINNAFRTKSYEKNCIGCHMVGYKPVKQVSGSDTTWLSGWANSNDTLSNKVGCENCHGAGSTHISGPNKNNIFGPQNMTAAGLQRQQEVCGQCHIRSSSTGKTYEYPWKESVDSIYRPGLVLSNFIAPWQQFFNAVGGPGVWPDTMTARQHHQQWQDMSYSNHNNFMNCYTQCHDPHTPTSFPHQLKKSYANNDLCLQCHTTFGTVGNPNIAKITQHTKHSYDPANTNGSGGTSNCVKCHMTKVAVTANSYDIASHNFKIVRPIKTLQKLGVSSPTLGMLNTCAVSCHRNPNTSAGTGNVPTLGVGTDATLTDWRQTTDSLLADTLNRWFNRQIWTVSVQNITSNIPSGFELMQNYPNPFNPSTEIRFSIPKNDLVSIKIYDIAGREVYNLLNQKLNAGTYSVKWNGINDIGENVSSGVYFYRMVSNDFAMTKKMILVK